MCGIIGYLGDKNSKDEIIFGLKKMEYRGYDSAGFFGYSQIDKQFVLYKSVGLVKNLEETIKNDLNNYSIGIGHTRWATHGVVNKINCHPHFSFHNTLVGVHNGVIDNYASIKSKLQRYQYEFISDTDTEVIISFLEYLLTNNSFHNASNIFIEEVKGTFALVVFNKENPDSLCFYKRGSSLLIGFNDNEVYIVSDISAIPDEIEKIVILEDNQYGYFSKKDGLKIFEKGHEVNFKERNHHSFLISDEMNMTCETRMEQEIDSSASSIVAIDDYFNNLKKSVLRKLQSYIKRKVIIIASGSSFYASLQGKRFLNNHRRECEVYNATMFADEPYMDRKASYLFISQSGETQDIVSCYSLIKNNCHHMMTITNNLSSFLALNVSFVLPMLCNKEYAVAATKSYISQGYILYKLSNLKHNESLSKLLIALKDIKLRKKSLYPLASKIALYKDIYILGRSYEYDCALEAALKFKEIAYLHSEALNSGELKHGPIACFSKDTLLIFLVSIKERSLKTRNNIKEVEARNIPYLVFSSNDCSLVSDDFIIQDSELNCLSIVNVFHYLALYVGIILGNDVDHPRNLAKSVTVE